MRRNLVYIYLLLNYSFFSGTTTFASDIANAACYANIRKQSVLQELNFFEQFMYPLMQKIFPLPEFVAKGASATLVRNRPDLWLLGKASACNSWAISFALCGDTFPHNVEDTEIDAIRHFMFATSLYLSRGRKTAEIVLAAHEEDPRLWKASDYMDAFNNTAALDWAEAQQKLDPNFRYNVSTPRIIETALSMIREKKLRVIRHVPEDCPLEGWKRENYPQTLKNAGKILNELYVSLAEVCENRRRMR